MRAILAGIDAVDGVQRWEVETRSLQICPRPPVTKLELPVSSQALGEFVVALRDVERGEHLDVLYELFEVLFPPGLSDDFAKEAARIFAEQRGFSLEDRPDKHAVRFVKDAPQLTRVDKALMESAVNLSE